MKGFVLLIEDGAARLVFTGYDGEEGHKRSHLLRAGLVVEGVEIPEMRPVAHDHVTVKKKVTA